jgi:hypothetical protein
MSKTIEKVELTWSQRSEMEDRVRKESIKGHLEAGCWFYRKGDDPLGEFSLKYFIIGKKQRWGRLTYLVTSFYEKRELSQCWANSLTKTKVMRTLFKGGYIPGGRYPVIPK